MVVIRRAGLGSAMSLLLSPDAFVGRAKVARGGLAPLAQSLASDLAQVIDRPLYIPEAKALLSREGGRCPADGAMLEFDPFSPRTHKCPRCGIVYAGDLHDLWWNYWYQLWLAERCVHAALLGALGIMPRAAGFAREVLEAYRHAYPRYPNVDNALGPTRPFFSTYLESIWLLQLCTAMDLLESGKVDGGIGSRFRDAVIEPSRALIATYDEGMSNRQVWNNAAMMAASLLLGRDDEAESLVWAESGIVTHLAGSMLPDGTWYEGENYHLFAHRGLWYTVQMCEAAGFEVPDDLVERYERGFVTPLLTSLPDLTFPSRRDSQYAISLRQWRFAEMCELGLARRPERVLDAMLHRLYDPAGARTDTGRWKSAAEAERNLPPTSLTRADLGWKSLLFANESPGGGIGGTLGSVLLDVQGIGVLRRDNDSVYVGLDYGVSGGGHGHPDRLNLLLMNGEVRILDDMGTGSYVDPSLHWYRSTLAHNAPMFDGRSQARVDGRLIAYEDRGGAGWISASAPIAPNAVATRTVVAMPDYAIDEVTWTSPDGQLFDLPLHVDAERRDHSSATQSINGSRDLEDGFRFVRDPMLLAVGVPNETMKLEGRGVDLWIAADVPIEIMKAVAPAAPGSSDAPFLILRSMARSGTIRCAWSWKSAVTAAAMFPNPSIETIEARHEHLRVEHGWQVAIHVDAAKSTIDLEGVVPESWTDDELARPRYAVSRIDDLVLPRGEPRTILLGEKSYRRSEPSWVEAGSPGAAVTLLNEDGALVIGVAVQGERSFTPPGSVNRLDNENADINGAGLQLYLRTNETQAGYVIVPIADTADVSIRPIDGWGDAVPVRGTWQPIDGGYAVDLHVTPNGPSLSLDLIVNEKPAGRERRRGQLVLSGGDGDFIYLRGDRHDPSRLIPFLIALE